jgi:3-dehydroquinate dehydratase
MMQKAVVTLLAAFACFVVPCPAHAGPVGDIKSTLATTRQQTMAMLSEDDHAVLEMRYEDALKSSKDLDTLLAAALKNDALRSDQPTLAQFRTVWEAFKKTRDADIIPALMSGSRLKARAMALTVQAPRFKKMNELLDSLPQ